MFGQIFFKIPSFWLKNCILYHFCTTFWALPSCRGLGYFLKTHRVIDVRSNRSNLRLYTKIWGVIGVRQSQCNTDQLYLKKNGASDIKTIENGFDIGSTIIHNDFGAKKWQKTIENFFLNHSECNNLIGVRQFYGTVLWIQNYFFRIRIFIRLFRKFRIQIGSGSNFGSDLIYQ